MTQSLHYIYVSWLHLKNTPVKWKVYDIAVLNTALKVKKTSLSKVLTVLELLTCLLNIRYIMANMSHYSYTMLYTYAINYFLPAEPV